MKEDIKEIALSYFKIFSQKNINGLREILSENVILRDWDIYAEGLENVLNANSNIFKNVNTIKIIYLVFNFTAIL